MDEDLPNMEQEKDSNNQYSYVLKVPKDRIAVIIGKDGEMKKDLESYSECSLNVDSKEGDVRIIGKDSINLYALKEVIKAIARGFNPDTAKLLLRQDYSLEIVNLQDYSDHKTHHLRLKGRVIGRKGKSRSTIEEMTGCFISVYGKTVAIIGLISQVSIARRAVESLLMGSMHASVYKWLEKQKRMSME